MANKTVTQVPVELKDTVRLVAEPIAGGTDVTAWLTYRVRDSADKPIGHDRAIALTLSAAQKTVLRNFLLNDAIPQANTAEET